MVINKNITRIVIVVLSLVVAASFCIGLLVKPVFAATTEWVYYSQVNLPAQLRHIGTDGLDDTLVYTPTDPNTSWVKLMAVDPIQQKLYIYVDQEDAIYKTNLDGTNKVTWLSITDTVAALAAYDGYVYYAETTNCNFYWRSADGLSSGTIYSNGAFTDWINMAAVDAQGQHLYYFKSSGTGNPGALYKTDLKSGTTTPQGPGSATKLLDTTKALNALDACNNIVYYAYGNEGANAYYLMRMNENGGSVTQVYYPTTGSITRVAVAVNEGKLYFFESNVNKVYKTSLPGSVGGAAEFASISGTNYTSLEIYSPPDPDIQVEGNATIIANGDSTPVVGDDTEYGNADIATDSIAHSFTIRNTGGANLNLTHDPRVTITGSDFAVTTQPGSPVAGAATTSFVITFNPNTVGGKTATVSIESNDPDENPYTFDVHGTGTAAPEMNLKQNVTSIVDGGSYDYSSHLINTNTDITFTIENTGTANLTLTLPLTLAGAASGNFSIITQPAGANVTPSGTATFTVRFRPTSTGAKTATIAIGNNDGNENPYDLTLNGTGTAPEMSVEGNSTEIADEDGSPSATDHTDFGHTDITAGTVVRTFTIKNTGTSNLNLTDASPYIVIGGPAAGDFAVTVIPSSSIAAAGSTTFQITFNPSATGARDATLSIANNDQDENPYNFSITGLGTAAPVITGLAGNAVTFTEGGVAVYVDSGVAATVTDDDASGYTGGTITVSFTGGTANDDLGFDGTHVTAGLDGIIAGGEDIHVDGTTIGSVNPGNDGQNGVTLIITLNVNATDARLSTLLQYLTYHNDSDDPPASRAVNVSISDIYDTSAAATVTVTITGINDPPTLAAAGANPAFTEGDGAKDLYNGVITISAVEASQTITQLVLTMTNVSNGASEVMHIDGSDVALTNGNVVTPTATNGMTVSVSITGTTATVTISKAGGISTALMQTLVDGMTYINSSENPLGSNRVITLTSIKDNGGTAGGGADTTAISIVSTVTITSVNDAPVVNNINGDSVDVVAGNGAVLIDQNSNAAATDVDSADINNGNLKIWQTGGTHNGNFGVDGTNVKSGDNGVIAAGENISVGGVVIGTVHAVQDGQSGNDLTINFNADATPARVQTLIRNITYASPNTLDTRSFSLSITDGDGIANGGHDTSTAADFTINVNPNPPVIANLDGDTVNCDPFAGNIVNLDSGNNSAVTDADSANFNGGKLTVTITGGSVPAEDLLNILQTSVVTLSGTTAGSNVLVSGTIIGTLTNNIANGNDMVVTFNANATPVRVITLLRAITYKNTNNINPTLAARTIRVTISDAAPAAHPGTSTPATITVNIQSREINVKQGITDIASGSVVILPGIRIGEQSLTIFTIQNTGSNNLAITVPITLNGPDCSEFSVYQQPAAIVAPAGTTTFTIWFVPGTDGLKTAVVIIGNNDGDENPYVITLQAMVSLAPAPPPPPDEEEEEEEEIIVIVGEEAEIDTDDSGEIQTTTIFYSDDKEMSVTLPSGTIILDEDGDPVQILTADLVENPPPPPSGLNMVGEVYDMGPSGVTFNPPVKLTLCYQHEDIPEGVAEKDLTIAFYDEATKTWIKLECTVDTVTNTITAYASHFTEYVVIPKHAPAAFTLSGLIINPLTAVEGGTVTIIASVKNTGELAGNCTVSLKINNLVIETQNITLVGGETRTVTFTVHGQSPGTFTVEVNGLRGSYEIAAPSVEPVPTTTVITPPPTTPASSTPIIPTIPVTTNPVSTTFLPAFTAPTITASTTPVETTSTAVPSTPAVSNNLPLILGTGAGIIVIAFIILYFVRRRD